MFHECSGGGPHGNLEILKAHLQHRQGSSQPKEPRQTPRMWAEAECHDQTWVTYDHFSSFQTWQQHSKEEALRVVREAHHWTLTMGAMLEGHIKCLHLSTSCGRCWGQEHPLSCLQSGSQQCLRSRGCSRSR